MMMSINITSENRKHYQHKNSHSKYHQSPYHQLSINNTAFGLCLLKGGVKIRVIQITNTEY